MFERTTTRNIVFSHPFSIPGIDQVLPPGTYIVETEEEQILGLSFVAYRRLNTTLTLPTSKFGPRLARQAVAIDPADLEAALLADATRATASG